MAFTKSSMKKELRQLFRNGRKENGRFAYQLDDSSDGRGTVHGRFMPNIRFGISQLSDDQISFSEYVHTVIDAFHEMHHCKQHWDVRKEKTISDLAIDLYADTGSHDYYLNTYEQQYSECDAEIVGVESARKYLNERYPGNEVNIDRHITFWGKVWFADAIPECIQDEEISFDEFMYTAKKYRDSLYEYRKPFQYEDVDKSDDLIAKRLSAHKKSGRISFMDNVFVEAKNGWTQRQAAFDMTVQAKKKELIRVIPALKNYQSSIDRYKHYRDVPDVSEYGDTYDSGKEFD